MARSRKLLIVSSFVMATIVIAFFSQRPDGRSLPNDQPDEVETRSERPAVNQGNSRDMLPDDGDHGVQPTIEAQSITENSPEKTTASGSISVAGWIETVFGEYLPGEPIVLYSPSQKARYTTTSDPFGEFEFTDIKPGWDYVLKVSPRGLFQRYTRSEIILRSDLDVLSIVLEPIRLGMLTGSLVDPYDRPVSAIELDVQTLEIDSWKTKTITDANGHFSVADFPKGRFKVSTRGKQTLRASGLNFDPDAGVPVNLVIDLGPFNIGGRIYDESGQTLDGANVYLNWAFNKNGARFLSTRKASANTNGEFQFTGVGPGKHDLVVTAWRGNDFRQTIKQTLNVGVDFGELMIVFNTL